MRTNRGIAAVLASLAVSFIPNVGSPAEIPGTAHTHAYFESADGTRLHADIYRPMGIPTDEPTPVLLEVTPYNAHSFDAASSPQMAQRMNIFEAGYTLVIVDLPGFGASGGCWDFAGTVEQTAVHSSVVWASTQPWSTGKVGMIGLSYAGVTGIMALATNPPGLAAVVSFAPFVSTYRWIYSDGVPHWWHILVPSLYGGAYSTPGGVAGDPASYHQAWLENGLDPNCVAAEAVSSTTNPDPDTPYWRERDMLERAAMSDVPVFGTHGFLDYNVPADQSLPLFERLTNRQALWVGQFWHMDPIRAHEIFGRDAAPQVRRFLDEHLRGQAPASTDPAVIVQGAPDLRWRAESDWPAPDAEPFAVPVLPGSYRDIAFNSAGDDVYVDPLYPFIFPLSSWPFEGIGSWTFTQPVPYQVHLSGTPHLSIQADGPAGAHLVALLYDVAADGEAYLISRSAGLVRDGAIDIDLSPQDWIVAPGHRLGLLVSGSDIWTWYPSARTLEEVHVLSGTLSIPALRILRSSFIDGDEGEGWSGVKRPIQVDAGLFPSRSVSAELPSQQTPPS